jgi:S1-C subfamily serine protease
MATYEHLPPTVDGPPRRTHSPLIVCLLTALVLLTFTLNGLLIYAGTLRSPGGPSRDVPPRTITPRGDLDGEEKGNIDLFKAVSPSVVHVTNMAVRHDRFSLNVQEVPRGTGTGFVWDADGYVVTNFHVVDGASKIRVVLADQSSFDSEQVWGFPDKDLAVVRISAPREKLKPIAVGTSHDLQVGQKTIAIGNPFGLDLTFTTGVVSALDREIQSANNRAIRGVIQTSAPINPGNSGGPLLDSAGRLIGVNTAILSPSGTFAGIGFAIPVDEVNRVVPELIAHGKVIRPRLGVQVAEDQLARRMGVTDGALILQVVPEGPARKADLHGTGFEEDGSRVLGDVIVAVDGKPVRSANDLYAALEDYKPGNTVTVTYARKGHRHDTKVTLDVSE